MINYFNRRTFINYRRLSRNISKKFTIVDYKIILQYRNCDCMNHPNVPWNPCCGCGLPDCRAQNQELENDPF